MQFHIMSFLTKPAVGEDLVVKHLNFRWRDRCLCWYSMSKLNSSSSDGDNILGGDTQAVCCSSAGEVVAA